VLAQLDPANPADNMPAAVHLEGRLQIPALREAFAEVCRRHEVLRTTFAEVEGGPAQVVASSVEVRLPVVDLVGLPAAVRSEELDRLLLAEGRQPFDLARGPLLRTGLFHLAADEYAMWVTMHHIVSDAWSIGVLVREVSVLYRAFATGLPSPLPALPLQYGDFSLRQRHRLQSESGRHLAYWRERLAGPLPVLQLPTDRPRPPVPSFRGARLARTLSPGATAEVRDWSRRQGTTFFLTLLTALTALLQRYTGQTDLLLGVPVANRNRDKLEGLIGFFVNVVVQRVDVSGAPSFQDLLRRVEEGFVGSSAHQELPFEQLVAELQPDRDLSRPPFFQVQLSLQNTPSAALELPGLSLRLLQPHNRTAKLDLTVLLSDDPAGLTTALEYSADLFDAARMDRLLGHWQTLLAGAVANPDRALPALPLLTEPERFQLFHEWNDPQARFSAEPPMHRRFEAQADRDPGAVAVVCEGSGITYRELDWRANALAWKLLALGMGPDGRVGLCVDRSVETVVGVLGILKAGCGYVPLDPSFPEDRIAWILEDALAGAGGERPVVVTQQPLAARFAALGSSPQVVLLDTPEVRAGRPDRPPGEVSADHLAYVIYTSGSTGRPKGVSIPHGNVARLFSSTQERFRFGPTDVWTLFHSYAFDFSVWEIWGALAFGGRLVVVPRDTARDTAAFHRLLESERVTVLNQTPSAFRQLVRTEEVAGARDLRLRLVIFGGEALDLNLLRPWLARHGDDRPELVNMYGITETTVHVTWRWIRTADLDCAGVSPVGRPIPDLQVHLLGPAGEAVPVGVPGEIFVGGAGLARGYLGRPELTAERFVPDPFAAQPGARLYRSGDLARRRGDGDLEYLGRIDHQVQIRGFRVELGEIEAALTGHPGVREAVVLARDAGEGEVWVTAYVVPRDGETPAGELRRHLSSVLPEYMLPRSFVSLDALPLTATGKVDRRALPEPAAGRPRPSSGAPRSPVEHALAEIWSEVLGVGAPGIHDDFFDLGGHSLVAAQVASRARAAFGVELPLRLLFEQPTVAGLAAAVEGLLRASGTPSDTLRAPIRSQPQPAGGAVPATFAQRRLWFLEQLTPGTALYNLPWLLRLKGKLDPAMLARALAAVASRHEALRTTFAEEGGEPLQVIGPPVVLPLPQLDLSALAPAARGAELARLLAAEAARPFDLAAGPLLRARLFRETAPGDGPAGHRLLIVVHHAVADGWSMEILGRELATLYAAALSGAAGETAPILPELPVQYADFARWQRFHLAGAPLAAQLAYWWERLAGAPTVLELPADRPRPAVRTVRGRSRSLALPADVTAALRLLCRRENATPFMFLLAAFDTLLGRTAGVDDLLVGTPVANRSREEIEGVIGLFVNLLVLRADLSGDPPFRALLRQVRETTLSAYAYQDLPFESLVEELRPERDLSRPPLVQVMFALHPRPAAVEGGGLVFEPEPVESPAARFDLSFYVLDEGSSFTAGIEYSADLFEPATMARLLDRFARLMREATAEPGRALSELPMIGEGERAQLLFEWNDTASLYPAERGLGELFEEQARRSPDRVAVIAGGVSLTYRELEQRSARLARWLAGLGVGAGARVALLLKPGPSLLPAMLGILRAQAAYVPVDPDYPAMRVAFVLEDAGVAAVLTDPVSRGSLETSVPVLLVDGAGKEGEWPEEGVAAHPARPEDCAYVIYTSGSTGRPKGVMVTHRNVVNFFAGMDRWLSTGPG
ncbi:MAG TPA: amino acid adenylation domain-containing protein, partial [Thermoanaerobaculia bacterium]|nr:amino acid adenylation domain-containing protein [Thermoanaerobaculia bacterium]